MKYIIPFKNLAIKDVAKVGGKNASLGEMIQHLEQAEIDVPSGFAITADAYWHHLESNKIKEPITQLASGFDKNDLTDFSNRAEQIRSLIKKAELPEDIAQEVITAYKEMKQEYGENLSVAVRSSATAEDLPHASFAGQQETYLNVGDEQSLLESVSKSFASLFTDRAISYRIDHGFNHMDVALSVGVQKMIRSDKACAGVMFTIDTESGHPGVIMINSSYGLGESVVKGEVNPDEFFVHKPTLEKGFKPLLKKRCGSKKIQTVYGVQGGVLTVDVEASDQLRFSLTDDEILELARYGLLIEKHYSEQYGKQTAMDIEWAKDGDDGKLYVVQARPETVHSQKDGSVSIEQYSFENRAEKKVIVTGSSVGNKIVSGVACIISSPDQMSKLKEGEILIASMTDPDWEPIMKRAGGIITERGGRTCHAAIVSRELGIPAIVGAHDALALLKDGQEITLDCSSGEIGYVYQGALPFKVTSTEVASLPKLPLSIYTNVGNPDEAFRASIMPSQGVGLARLEFIINGGIKVHPMALVDPEKVTDKDVAAQIESITNGYTDKKQYFVDTLAQEAGTIVAAFYPRPVIVRLSDFKSNEYRQLIGGRFFEPEEENPMIGFRGASRYYSEEYKDAFALECQAMKKIRDQMGLDNFKLMLPFVRTPQEAEKVINIMAEHDLVRGQKGLEIYMMVELPSNVMLIEQFAQHFDGFSIGSNDLTQMTLAVDRDSSLVASLFDERDEAVKKMIQLAVQGAQKQNKPIGICGQAPSDFPEFAQWLKDIGISSLSLNADTVISTWLALGS